MHVLWAMEHGADMQVRVNLAGTCRAGNCRAGTCDNSVNRKYVHANISLPPKNKWQKQAKCSLASQVGKLILFFTPSYPLMETISRLGLCRFNPVIWHTLIC